MRELAGLGGYFAVETGPAAADWRPLSELLTGGELIAARVEEVARRLGTGERRVAASLELGRLRGTGRFAGEPFFVRRSCCLYYRVPGGGTCGDCVLAQSGRTA
ncbi:(2Fe-2S)-binding protein [Acrocarpospora catenulata]|uniref:(2Fe-2S)-binding protein n=1 Tax=Acrocarpospora catenulata TaxID=2836182 RepID=UPI002023B9CB|nr:(2Fe-2S)-binding protein [Acrocarpospora catenulata]